VAFYFFLELGILLEDGFEFFLEEFFLAVEASGVGEFVVASVDDTGDLGVIEVALAGHLFHLLRL
jgi:hypothetical protein